MTRFLPSCALLLCLIGGVLELRPALAASADSVFGPTYAYDIWQVEEGWVPTAVSSIVQTHDGYIWLGTYQGLLRFDGVNFTSFDSTRTPGLQNSRITALFEDAHDTLWIGHETGELTRLHDGVFTPVNLGSKWSGGEIRSIATDANEDAWIMTKDGLLARVRDGLTTQPPQGLAPNSKLALSRGLDGRIWVGVNGAVTSLENDRLNRFRFTDPAPSDYFDGVAASRDGGLWAVGNGRVRKWLEGRWKLDLGDCPWKQGFVTVLLETRAGGLLVGTLNDGLYLLNPGAEPLHYTRANGLTHDWVRSLAEDHEGNIWLGTGAGLNVLRPRKVKMLDAPDHWAGRAVLSFSIGKDGSAWISTEGAGVYHYDNGFWSTYREANGLSSLYVWSALQTSRDELLVGTWGGGLFMRQGDGFVTPPAVTNLTAPIICQMESHDGAVWIGTTLGIYRYQGGTLARVAGKDELTLPDVRAMAESSDGSLWFGLSGGGLARLKDGAWKQFRKRDGLNSDFIQALYADADGSLWIGSSDNGLGRWKHGRFSVIGAEQGLPASVICQIIDDGSGHLWLGTHGGIFRMNKQELSQCADGSTPTVPCRGYGKAEGLTSLVCSGGQPSAARTPQGLLWFATAKGIAMIDPANVSFNTVPPPVVIEGLLADGQPQIFRSAQPTRGAPAAPPSATIAPGRQRFEIRFTGLSFAAPDKVRFKYKLEPLEPEWVSAGVQRSAHYSYLRPGTYTFRVKACNNDEVWNENGAVVEFTVLPLLYQTWWFQAGLLGVGAAAVGLGVLSWQRRRLRHKLEQLERQRALERERARIARDIHDDLGASLTRITLLSQSARSELDGQPQAASEVDQIYQTARELTRAMDEIVWAVNPRHDTLDSLVTYLGRYAQNYLSTASVRCRLEVPLNLPAWAVTAEVRHNVFLVFKESLHNVLKHAAATEVRISLEVQADGFILAVADNGRGFDARTLPQRRPGAEGPRLAGGNGLLNMLKRAEEIGARCEWTTAPGEGTRVKMTVTLGNCHQNT